MARLRAIAYYGVPMLYCTVVDWLALKTWFYSDDFAWLGLSRNIHSAQDLIVALFRPEAQGTIRVFSERLFFMVLYFGFWPGRGAVSHMGVAHPVCQYCAVNPDSLPFDRVLSGWFLAGLLWTANASLALAQSWVSSYNEVACALFMLLAFRVFLLYIDTGACRYWIWQWIVFQLGFGVLELNVVYPAGSCLCDPLRT